MHTVVSGSTQGLCHLGSQQALCHSCCLLQVDTSHRTGRDSRAGEKDSPFGGGELQSRIAKGVHLGKCVRVLYARVVTQNTILSLRVSPAILWVDL